MPEWKIMFPSPELEQKAIEQGKRDAQTSLDMGPGAMYQKLINYQKEQNAKMMGFNK